MTTLEDAYTTSIFFDEPISFTHTNSTDTELLRLQQDRDNIYDNLLVTDSIFTNPIITDEEHTKILIEYDISQYVQKCKEFKTLLSNIISKLNTAQEDYVTQSTKVQKLLDIIQCLKHHFNNQNDIIRQLTLASDKESLSLGKLEDELLYIKKTLYVLHKASPHFVQNDPRKLCSICVENEVDVCNVPCGHTMCSGCSNMISSRNCFICRTEIQNTIKLYFS